MLNREKWNQRGTFTFLEGWAAKPSLLFREGKAPTTVSSRKLSSRPTDNYQHLSTDKQGPCSVISQRLSWNHMFVAKSMQHFCCLTDLPLPWPLTKFTLGHVQPDGQLWALFSEGFIAWIVLQIFIERSLRARYCVLGNTTSKTKSLPSNCFSSRTEEQVMSKRPSQVPRFGAKCSAWKGIKWGEQGRQPGCWERQGNINVTDILNGGSSISEFGVQ